MAQMANGLWKQKHIIVPNAISLGGGFANLIDANIPDGTDYVIIVKDTLSGYINNQLVEGLYCPNIGTANGWCRYRNNEYTWATSASQSWTDTYALTASQGDTYTLFYQ